MGDDLVAFLSDRLDEDEQAATDDGRVQGDEWTAMEPMPHEIVTEIMRRGSNVPVAKKVLDNDARHIARHDPARVLREVEAKRRTIDLHSHRPEQAWDGSALVGDCKECIDEHYPCATLRLLALPYADHPDYRAGWKP